MDSLTSLRPRKGETPEQVVDRVARAARRVFHRYHWQLEGGEEWHPTFTGAFHEAVASGQTQVLELHWPGDDGQLVIRERIEVSPSGSQPRKLEV